MFLIQLRYGGTVKMITNIKGAIFDMDGTLVDSLMLWNVIWEKFGDIFCGGRKFVPAPDDDKSVRTMTLKDAMDYLHLQYAIGKNGDELLEAANRIIEEFYSGEVKLKDGVAEFLEYCYNNGIKMCIASATYMNLIKIAVEHCNIGKYFENIFSCAEIGKGKDKPDIYLMALECLGTKIDETCIFEDSYVAIETADKLGIKTVGIYDKYNYDQDKIKTTATVYIGDGESLKKLIGREC